MKRVVPILAAVAILAGAATPVASGWIGIYAMIERAELVPKDSMATGIRLWGAFAFVDGTARQPGTVSTARRGQMYFAIPACANRSTDCADAVAIRREWADLMSVAGTGTAVGFGSWRYFGIFGEVDPANANSLPTILLPATNVATQGRLSVAPDSAKVETPFGYSTEVGVVRLSASGSHATIVNRLRAALAR